MNNTVKITIAALSGIALGYAIGRYLPPIIEALKDGIEEEEKLKQQKAHNDLMDKVAQATATMYHKANDVESDKIETMVEKELPEAPDGFPLQLGSKGHEVERVQVFLMRKLGFVRPPTSLFDHFTLSRVESWFKTNQISQELYEKLKLDKMLHDQRKTK